MPSFELETKAVDMVDYVNRLEAEIAKHPQAELPVWHHFAPGLYARQMLIRKDTILTGAVHKTEHLCIVSGVIDVTTDTGVVRIADMQHILKSMPGTKRAGVALEDTWWTTVHATEETDLERLVEELTESTLQQLAGGPENVQVANRKLEA